MFIEIEKQTARYFVQNSECPSNPPPFFTTQRINPFLNSRISTNHDKVDRRIVANGEILIPLNVPIVYNLFYLFLDFSSVKNS